MIVTAKAALACLQYPIRLGLTGGPHFFVIYQGAPGCGCLGSLISDPAWLWALTAHMATSAAWMTSEIRG